ncbi:hypothetical protein COCSADRAFT_37239 [Bipolaris sorokiniana ND90Pr]|uniref:Uncharacterized protein n=1 Tax=Cochliobolus sativus (strain ND90Pr / ATCC 201652) TaxID=665912 RepID=M2R944_COCSN|nr:uncharacterized protein COCSADRAFT_37239 [Bipolaris sorokiniana ND90Pr]EMD63454.1 hypothetical protein COCSADRAFT_37239 [Bipolaris sorokiniana ND90Pr]
MKYAIIFAATAAAHQAYGGYGADAHSSVEPSTTATPIGYTTVVPGYGKQPVTVTTQHQAYPTCVTPAYGDKGCAKWGEDTYVSTVIKDYDNNYATVTNTEQPVVVYHTKTTITHSATGTGGYAAPTGTASKNGTADCWYELYEKIEEVPYKNLGPKALPGYSGSGLYTKGDKEQPVHVKEYKGGKWSEYEHVYSHGEPKPEVKVYEKPGVYVVPSKDMVVDHPVDHPAEATTTAKAGETCTYGGQSVTATQTGYITAPYAGYKTKVEGDKTMTETVIEYTTIYASTTGTYEVTKPTTTVYDHDTEVTYPTAQHYDAGVYHQPAQTVTITSAGQAYTCEYEKTKATPSPMVPGHGKAYGGNSYGSYPAHNSSSIAYGSYPAASTPAAHGSYPAASSPAAYGSYPAASSPAAVHSKPAHYGGNNYGAYSASTMSTVPVQAYSTPAAQYPASSSPAAYEHSYPVVSSPAAYGSYPAASSPAAYQPAPAVSSPAAYGSYPAASSPAAYENTPAAYEPAPAASTPAAYENTPAAYEPAPVASTPAAYDSYPAVSSPAAYEAAPAASTPAAYENTPAAYEPAPVVSTPAAYENTPAAYEPAATPTPAAYENTPSNEYSSGSEAYGSSEKPSESYSDYAAY